MKSDTKIKKSKRVEQSNYDSDSNLPCDLEIENKSLNEIADENEFNYNLKISSNCSNNNQTIKKVSETKDISNKDYPENLINQKKSKYEKNNLEPDLFDDSGNVKAFTDKNQEELKKAISSIRSTISDYSNLSIRLIDYRFITPLRITIKKISTKITIPVVLMINKLIKFIGKVVHQGQAPVMSEVIKEEKPINYLSTNFESIKALNITFTDNYNKPLYIQNKTNQPLSKMQEDLILSMSIEAIQKCAGFMTKIPPPKDGRFKDIPMYDLMISVTSYDIQLFLGYVSKKPKKYACNKWKISETYATWLMNNSPVIEVKG